MNEVSPFKPGYGGMPPYLAGRETEQALLEEALDVLKKDGEGIRGIVMYGPRGMGKTVLLRWLERRCLDEGVVPSVVYPEKGGLPLGKFTELLPPKSLPAQVSIGGKAGVDFGVKAEGTFNVTWPASDKDREGNLESHLLDACRQKPRALLLDEAHTLEEDACQALLTMVQSVASQAPLLFVMAGTPGLVPFLGTVGATFVGRSKKIGIGALSPQAAADAIRIPLQSAGGAIQSSALDTIVEDSQCYPFFLQEWGDALWCAVKGEGLSIDLTQAQVDAANKDFRERKEVFYAERYEAMRNNAELLIAANAVSERFKDAEGEGAGGKGRVRLNPDEISIFIERSLAEAIPDDKARKAKALELEQELNRIDYFWQPPGGKAEPGIPSFMAYLSERFAERTALRRT